MSPLNHQQARQWIEQAADGLLNAEQQASLGEHLATCAECRASTRTVFDAVVNVRAWQRIPGARAVPGSGPEGRRTGRLASSRRNVQRPPRPFR